MSLSTRMNWRSLVASASIIGVLLASTLLGGCSAVRLGYNNGPSLMYWWLDGYFDFDDGQTRRMRRDLQATHDWHRKTELPLLANTLKELQNLAPKPVSADQVCTIVGDLQTRLQVTLERITPGIAAIAPGLQEAQLEHIAQAYEKRERKWRDDWLDGNATERSQRRIKQIVERAESLYGPLEAAQIAVVRTHIGQSTFDGSRQFREMQRRHQESLAVLRKVRSGETSAAQAPAEIRRLLLQTFKSPDPAYRRYIDQLTAENCAALANLHNSSTPEQRARLVQTLKGYESDARALAAERLDDNSSDPTPSAL